MDGIEITRILDMDSKKEIYYSCENLMGDYEMDDGLPDEQIQNIIEANVPAGPDFKHLVKLTPNLMHRSLKKRIKNRRSLNDIDEDDTGDSTTEVTAFNKSRVKMQRDQKNATMLRAEISDLKEELQRCKAELSAQKQTLDKVNSDLRRKIILLEKCDKGLKKRGRRIGGAKIREELGISGVDSEITSDDEVFCECKVPSETDGEEEKTPKIKRGRGRPRKQSQHVENNPETSPSRVPVAAASPIVKKTPLKEKDLNTGGSTLRVSLEKLELDVLTVVEKKEDDNGPLSPIRRSNRQMRCTEKFASMIEMSPKIDGSMVVRKILNEEEASPEVVPQETKLKRKRKMDASPKEDSVPLKREKKEEPTAARRDSRAGSTTSDSNSTSCRSFKQAKQAMMKGVASKRICEKCLEGSTSPYKCQKCFTFFHPKCVGDLSTETDTDWMCPACISGKNPCFVCKLDKGTRQMCLTTGCGKYYHHDCLKLFPQTKFNHGERKDVGLLRDPDDDSPPPLEILVCARHTCHTCTSDNPMQAKFVHQDKLLNCVKCPTSYHCTPGVCLTAGTEILSTSDIICGKHLEAQSSRSLDHINITWCFICTKGGHLTYCALCPSAIHPDCLKIKPPEGKYYCEECESGRFPLHGEIVWVKLGSYRWWPSKVLYPDEVPDRLEKIKHRRCEFAVMFFGTKDYQWVSRGRTFIYNEGDTQKNFRVQKRLDRNFQLAMEEASQALEQRQQVMKNHSMTKKEKPEPYMKIRSNKFMMKNSKKNVDDERNTCSCSVEDDEPCGPNSNCLNRGLLIECSPDFCPARSKCLNQRFAKREYPPLVIFKTADRGWGVRCKDDLQPGQFVIEYVGEVIDEAELERRLKIKRDSKNPNYYLMRLDSNQILDAEPCGNNARFINHSCRPNCETQKWSVNGVTKIGIFALKFIPSGEELTFNYDWTMKGMRSACYCEAEGCSGVIGEIPKAIKGKKKKVKSKAKESECSVCQAPGQQLIVCSSEKCPRVVHVKCLNPSTKPDDWTCSHHLCDKCGSKTKINCQECKVAYCSSHTNTNIFSNEKGELFCSKHVAEKPFNNNVRKSAYLSRKEQRTSDDSSSTSSCI